MFLGVLGCVSAHILDCEGSEHLLLLYIIYFWHFLISTRSSVGVYAMDIRFHRVLLFMYRMYGIHSWMEGDDVEKQLLQVYGSAV